MNPLEFTKLNKDGLMAFFTKAPEMNLDSRLRYFYDLLPYAEYAPGSLYLLGADSTVLACNEYCWKQLKMNNPSDVLGHNAIVIGRTLGWPEHLINQIIKDDQRVFRETYSIHQETIPIDDFEQTLICKKEALYKENGKPLGIIGMSIPVESKHRKIRYIKEKKLIVVRVNSMHSITFTVREFTVLQGILNGKSSAEMAKQYSLSSKTIETYIAHVKLKLSCNKLREITPFLLKHEIASSILELKF